MNRSAGVAQEMNLKHSAQARKQESDIQHDFETQGRRHQNSNTVVSFEFFWIEFCRTYRIYRISRILILGVLEIIDNYIHFFEK